MDQELRSTRRIIKSALITAINRYFRGYLNLIDCLVSNK